MMDENRRVTLDLPAEFLELCEYDLVSPDAVLREFIADLCSISSVGTSPDQSDRYQRNAPEDIDRARAYYDRIHRWKADWMRDNLPNYVKQRRARQESKRAGGQ